MRICRSRLVITSMMLAVLLVHGITEDDEEPLRKRLLYNVKGIHQKDFPFFPEDIFEDFGRELVLAGSLSMCMSSPSSTSKDE